MEYTAISKWPWESAFSRADPLAVAMADHDRQREARRLKWDFVRDILERYVNPEATARPLSVMVGGFGDHEMRQIRNQIVHGGNIDELLAHLKYPTSAAAERDRFTVAHELGHRLLDGNHRTFSIRFYLSRKRRKALASDVERIFGFERDRKDQERELAELSLALFTEISLRVLLGFAHPQPNFVLHPRLGDEFRNLDRMPAACPGKASGACRADLFFRTRTIS